MLTLPVIRIQNCSKKRTKVEFGILVSNISLGSILRTVLPTEILNSSLVVGCLALSTEGNPGAFYPVVGPWPFFPWSAAAAAAAAAGFVFSSSSLPLSSTPPQLQPQTQLGPH